jgi:hypothetical protein
MPQISYWKIDWGNGTVDFYAEVIDWPLNETSTYLLFTQNYFSTWTNLTMTEISESSYFARVGSLEYDLQNLWYYVSATDAFNWNDPGISQASNFTLSDTISPIITLSIENSTENDGEITVFAYAIDPYGDTHFINNTFYINFTYADNHNVMLMEYDSFYTYKKSYRFPVGEQVIISVWVGDNSGNLGTYSYDLTISDDTPPKIKSTGALVFQNGTVTIWAEVVDYGSGLYDDNSSIHLEYTHIYHHTVLMQWNGSDNFYTYSIQGFEPGTAFYFYLTAFDKSNNHASTSPQEVLIFDETDPICIDHGFNEIVLNQYSCSLNFWVEAFDPFGSIDEVNLTVKSYSDGSNSKIENVKMFNNGSHYVYSLTIKCNQSFNYSIMIYDEALNSIRIGENFQQTSPFQSAIMMNFGILPSESDRGGVLLWCEIQDSFNSHNVTLSVKDETLNKWILNETNMTPNKTHHNYLLTIEYLHNYSYTMRVIDDGVLEGYYEASQYIGFHQMSDYWEPKIDLAGIEKVNDTTIIVWANVSDWGSGVSEVYFRYEITSQEQAGGYGAEIELKKVPMIYNETYYIAEVSFSKTVTIEWFIEAYDSLYQSNTLPQSYTYFAPPPSITDFIPAIIVAIVGTILALSTLYAASAIYRKRKSQKLTEVIEAREKLNSLLNTYVILVTTAVGLPVYNINNIMYQSTNAIQDVLSGLSVGIDSFLESFQSDIVDFFLETDSDLFDSQTQDDIKTSIIEKNKVLIQIISSPSFRIFLFLKKKPPEYLKSAFISIARGLEEKIVLDELGVVDENFVAPIAKKVISQHFPLALLFPFQIDLQKLNVVEEKIKQGAPISKNISISALNALKRLVIIKSNLDVSINDPQAQINLFDKSLAQNKLQNIPPLILNEALDIFKILKVSTKVIYKALWLGTDPTINIVVSHAIIPREEIPIIQ